MAQIKRDKSNSSIEVKSLEDRADKFGEARNFEISSPEDELNSLTRSFKMKLKGRQESVRAVAIIPPHNGQGSCVIAGREDKIACIWDLETGVEKGKFVEGHSDQISCIFVLTRSSGDIVALTGSDDCSIVMWNIQTFKPIIKISAHTNPIASIIAFESNDYISSGGSQSVNAPVAYLISAAVNGSAAVRNLDTGEKMYIVDVEGEFKFNTLAYYYKAGISSPYWVIGGDETVTCWTLQGKMIARFEESSSSMSICYSSRDETSEKNPVLVSLNRDGSVISILNLDTMKQINRIERESSEAFHQIDVYKPHSATGFVILASCFNIVQTFDMLSGACLDITLQGSHSDEILSMKICEVAGSYRLLTGSADNSVCIWDPTSHANTPAIKKLCSSNIEGHAGLVMAVATYTDRAGNTKIITASSDMTAIVWEINMGTQLLKLEGGHTKGILAVCCFESSQLSLKPVVFTCGVDATICKWDLNTGVLLKQVSALHSESIRAMALYSLTGVYPIMVTVAEDYAVCCYDWENESILWQLTDVHIGNIIAVDVKMMTINAVRIPIVLTGSEEKTSKFIRDGVLDSTSLVGHSAAVTAVALLSVPNTDQNFAITASLDSKVIIWDVFTKLKLREIRTLQEEITSLSVYCESAGRNYDGGPQRMYPCIVTGSKDKTACIWDVITGNRIRLFEGGHSREVSSVSVLKLNNNSKNNAIILITAAFDNSAIVWDLNNCERSTLLSGKGHLESIITVATPNDQFAISADCNSIRYWDLQDSGSKCPRDVERFHIDTTQDHGHKQEIVAMTAFEEADLALPSVVTSSADGEVLYWKFELNHKRVVNFEKPKKNISAVIHCLASAQTPQGPIIFGAGDEKEIIVWNINTGAIIKEFPEKHVKVITLLITCYIPKIGLVVVSGGKDRTLISWSYETGHNLKLFAGQHGKEISAATVYTPPSLSSSTSIINGGGAVGVVPQLLISASMDKKCVVWDLVRGVFIKRLNTESVHKEAIKALEIAEMQGNNGGPLLIVGGLDGVVSLWDVNAGNVIHNFNAHPRAIHSLSLTPSLQTVSTRKEDDFHPLLPNSTNSTVGAVNGLATVSNLMGRMLVTGGVDCDVCISEVNNTQQLLPKKIFPGCPRFSTVAMAAYVPSDNSAPLIFTAGEKMLRRTNCITREQDSADISLIPKRLTSIVVVSRGDPVALVGSSDGKLGMWDVNTMQLLSSNDIISAMDWSSKSPVTSIAVYSSIERGLYLTVLGFENKFAVVWDQLHAKPICTLAHGHIAAIRSVAVIADDSPNGSKKIFAITAGDDRTATVWEIPSGKLIGKLQDCHQKSISAISSFKNGDVPYLVTASMDTTAAVWNLLTLERTKRLEGGHSSAILCVDTFVPSDMRSPIAITGSVDRSVVVWHMRRGEKLRHFPDISQFPITAISIYSDKDGISPIVIISDKKNNIQVRDLYPSTFMPLHADVIRAYELDKDETISTESSSSVDGWSRISKLSGKYRIGFWLEHGFLFKEAIKENRVDFLMKFKDMLTESLFTLRGVHSLLYRAIQKGSTDAVKTIVDCWIHSLNSPCSDPGGQLYWHPFHFLTLADLRLLSQDYPELAKDIICSVNLITASQCTLARYKLNEGVSEVAGAPPPPSSPTYHGRSGRHISVKMGAAAPTIKKGAGGGGGWMSSRISPYASIVDADSTHVDQNEERTGLKINTVSSEVLATTFAELDSRGLEEAYLGENRQYMLGVEATESIGVWSWNLGDGHDAAGERGTQPVTPMFLPLQGAANLEMLKLFVSLSETLNSTEIFESEAGMLCLQYAWDTVGSKSHFMMLVGYMVFVIIYSIAVFAFYSLRQLNSIHTHRLAWALQLVVLAHMGIYLIKQIITYMHLKGESLFNFLFDNVWNIQDFISFVLVTVGIFLRIAAVDETDDSRSVLAVASILVWFKCLYYMRAYEGSGPLVAMVLKIAYDIRYFVTILLIVLTGFSQAFWLISYPDESLNFGTISSAFMNSYLFMLGGFDGDFSGTTNASLGSFLLAIFMFFMAIHMLNLLIALMGETFENVSEKKLPQWRWEQAAIILEEQEQLEIFKSVRLKFRARATNLQGNLVQKRRSSTNLAGINATEQASPIPVKQINEPNRSESIHLLRYSGDVVNEVNENITLSDVMTQMNKMTTDMEKSVTGPVATLDTALKQFKEEIRHELDEIKELLMRLAKNKDRNYSKE